MYSNSGGEVQSAIDKALDRQGKPHTQRIVGSEHEQTSPRVLFYASDQSPMRQVRSRAITCKFQSGSITPVKSEWRTDITRPQQM